MKIAHIYKTNVQTYLHKLMHKHRQNILEHELIFMSFLFSFVSLLLSFVLSLVLLCVLAFFFFWIDCILCVSPSVWATFIYVYSRVDVFLCIECYARLFYRSFCNVELFMESRGKLAIGLGARSLEQKIMETYAAKRLYAKNLLKLRRK